LPFASIISLADFHAAFHVFCERIFPADLLYPQCCHEFQLLTKELDTHEEYVALEDISHHDQEMGHPHHDNHTDAFVITSNTSIVLGCHEDHIVSLEKIGNDEKINKTTNDSFRSVEVDEDNLQFPNLQGLSNIQLEHENYDQECVDAIMDTIHESLDPNYREDPNPRFESSVYIMGNPHFLDLQTKEDCSTYEASDGGEKLKSLDQRSVLYFPPAKIKQFTFGNEFCEGKEGSLQHLFNLQSDQQLKEVFFHDFEDPIADFLILSAT
jgi:hypothetical protein